MFLHVQVESIKPSRGSRLPVYFAPSDFCTFGHTVSDNLTTARDV